MSEEAQDNIFLLEEEDYEYVNAAKAFTRRLVALPYVKPKELLSLSRALYALERMPDPSPGVVVEYGISLRRGNETNEEMKFWNVAISEESFEISEGGSGYSKAVGSDTYSSVLYFIETGDYSERKGDAVTWLNTAMEAMNMNAEVSIDMDDSTLDCMEDDE